MAHDGVDFELDLEVEEVVPGEDRVPAETSQDEVHIVDEREELDDDDEEEEEEEKGEEEEEDVRRGSEEEGNEDDLDGNDPAEDRKTVPGAGLRDAGTVEEVSDQQLPAGAETDGSRSGYRVSRVRGRELEELICLILGVLRLG